jgi:hypothetical protein
MVLRISRTKAIIALLAVGVLIGIAMPAGAYAQSLSASVDRTTVYQGDQVIYTVELQGARSAKQTQFPTFEGFRILSGPSESSNFQIINGQMSSSVTYTWRLIPQRTGTLSIPPAWVVVGKKTITSNPVSLQVVSSTNIRAPAAAGPPDVMVKVDISKREVYANEPVSLTYKLYFRKNLSNYEVSKLPNTVGFWSEDVPIPDQNRLPDENIQGYRYGVVLVRKATLFPTNPGDLTVDPLEVTCNVQEQQQTVQRRSRGLFDSFFDDPFFGGLQVVTKSVSTQPIHLKVKPLPVEDRPDNFAGDVGQYTMNVTVDPNEVAVNDALTLKVTISGKGNIRLINEPKVDVPLDIERYDPKITYDVNKGNVISGRKSFEYLLIPRVPGQQKIPAVQFAYFDPTTEQYQTLQSGPLAITVQKGKGFVSNVDQTLSREDVQWRGQDIRYIKLVSSPFQRIGGNVSNSAAFYGLLLAPLVLFGLGLLYRGQLDRMEQNVSRTRRSRAYNKAMKRWKDAGKTTEKNGKAFYGNISRTLGGYLADVLNLPEAAGGTEEALVVLQERQVNEEVISEIRDIFNSSDFARFAAGQDSSQDRDQLLNRTRKIMQQLEKEIKV